jgi:hypothetical protein
LLYARIALDVCRVVPNARRQAYARAWSGAVAGAGGRERAPGKGELIADLWLSPSGHLWSAGSRVARRN